MTTQHRLQRFVCFAAALGMLAAAAPPARAQLGALVQGIAGKVAPSDEAINQSGLLSPPSEPDQPAPAGQAGVLDIEPAELTPGGELEELEEAQSVFEQNPALLRLLGSDPDFVYESPESPDPMVLPWVRDRVVCEELLALATMSFRRGDYATAREHAGRVLDTVNRAQQRGMASPGLMAQEQGALELLGEIADAERDVAMQQGELEEGAPREAVPPQAVATVAIVADNVNAIAWGVGVASAIIGSEVVSPGQKIPNLPMDVFVEEIGSDGVVRLSSDNLRWAVRLRPDSQAAEDMKRSTYATPRGVTQPGTGIGSDENLRKWLAENLRGVLRAPDYSACVFGDTVLPKGGVVPVLPFVVTVAEVEGDTVAFAREDKILRVPLQSQEEEVTALEEGERPIQ